MMANQNEPCIPTNEQYAALDDKSGCNGRDKEVEAAEHDPNAGHVFTDTKVLGNGLTILGNVYSDEVLRGVGQEDRRALMQRFLYYDGMQSRLEQIRARAGSPESVRWIWSTTFPEWLEKTDAFYWITGQAGSGKSSLMKHISRSGRTLEALQRSGTQWTTVDFFFDFRMGRDLPNRIEGMFRAFLHQLVQKLPSAAPGIYETGRASAERLTMHELADLVAECIRSIEQNVCVFTDGLDEYQGLNDELLAAIQTFADQARPKVKICLASRPEPLFKERLSRFQHIAVQDYNDEGIKFYTGSAWQNQHVDAGAKFSKEMSDLIREKAAGSFLWARLAVDEAVQGVLAGTPREQLLRDLTKLPTDIRAMYEDMLNRLPNAMQTAAIIMLRLIDAAGGQLELDKLCAAFASAIRHADIETPILFSDLSADSTALVLGLLGGFIDVVKADLPVREKLCVRFESSTLQIRSNDSAMIKFSHETLRALCSHSVWLNHRTPSSFLTMYPDNLWLRLYTAEMVACKYWILAHWAWAPARVLDSWEKPHLQLLLSIVVHHTQEAGEITSNLLSTVLIDIMQIANIPGDIFNPRIVPGDRMCKVIEVLSLAPVFDLGVDCSAAIYAARILHGYLDSIVVFDDPARICTVHLKEEASQIVNLLEYAAAHQGSVPPDVAVYESYNCGVAGTDGRGGDFSHGLLLGRYPDTTKVGSFTTMEEIQDRSPNPAMA
ncbi:hypothetical protein PMZ80_009004 [Knufia obscura]|uniref:Nephrocystin 3-like N-terminal domain-containing protein n=1 Tax=Knufia obscura TaxID=1635080 RepID=A0ABR0REZ5_9EURO|nr:hypothetical protein PMZ80_009004 [Knufia obscura]